MRTAGTACWRRARFGTLADLADAERISRSYVCRVLRLTLLAPDIVERILDGRPTAGLAQFLKPFPVEWERQRQKLLEELHIYQAIESRRFAFLQEGAGPSLERVA